MLSGMWCGDVVALNGSARCMPVRHTPMRYTPVRCTPMRCTPMRCTHVRYTLVCEAHASICKMHVYEV
jgi:hypothetical protein